MDYFLTNSTVCGNILGGTVTLQVSDTIASDKGFTVQLNGSGSSATVVWQQYGFNITGNSIKGFINNWSGLTTAINCDTVDLCSTPINNAIPAGYTLSLTLLNDASGNVTGANYQVTDNHGATIGNKTFMVSQARCNCNFPKGFTCAVSGAVAPVQNMTLDIVGPGNGARASFSGGAATLTYSASGPLVAGIGAPTCDGGLITAETSNAAYSVISPCPNSSLSHSVAVTPDPAASRVCFTSNGPCTGAGGSDQCMTIAGTTKCCHSNWLWGWFPSIASCSDGTVTSTGCGGPCY